MILEELKHWFYLTIQYLLYTENHHPILNCNKSSWFYTEDSLLGEYIFPLMYLPF